MGLDVTGGITGDLIAFNNSAGGYVQAGGDVTHDIIGFGGGAVTSFSLKTRTSATT